MGPLERAITQVGRPGGATERSTRAQSALQEVMRSLLVLSGLGIESMVRDIGWRFMDAGRRLERSLQLLSLLRRTVCSVRGDAADSMMLESVLTTAESIITYRLRYRARAQLETVLELLLLDPGNPRSLAYQLERLTEDLEVLPHGVDLRLSEERRMVLAAHTDLRLAEIGSLVGDQAPVVPTSVRRSTASPRRARGWTRSCSICTRACRRRPTRSTGPTSSTSRRRSRWSDRRARSHRWDER